MKSLLGGLASSGRSVLKVASERGPAVPTPSNLVRTGRSGLANWFRAPTLPTTGAERYGTDPTLFPIISSLAQDTGNVDFKLFAPGESGKDEDREEIKPGAHPCVDLLLNPNPFYSQAEFIETAQQHIDSVGECILLVEYLLKIPVRLWVIPPWKLTPVKSGIIGVPAGQKFLTGWMYTGDNGEQVPLSINQIIQIKLPNPADPYRGIGPVQAALTMLDNARYTAEWNRNFFLNGASPDGVVQIEENFSDDEFKEFTERWRESHQGLSNAHRVAVLENGAVWVPNMITHRDMQFQELQTLSSDFIRKAFRFPKTMLGDTDDANRAVAEAGEYTYGKWMIAPRARRWCAALNNRLMPLFGSPTAGSQSLNTRGLYWDFEPVVDSDEQVEAVTLSTRATGAQTLIQTGVEAEDAFAVMGLPPMRWKKPEVPGFDEDGKPFPKPGESGSDGSKSGESSGSKRRDREGSPKPGESQSGSN